jgi:succinoglycan biosynthesis protein ExoM
MLRELLVSLNAQRTDDVFSYRVRVVDNDCDRSAFPVVSEFRALAKIPVAYDVEPRQNIALARNRAVCGVRSDFIALIDDDERPSRDWLLHLFRAIEAMKVDAVLGPVQACFPAGCPTWLERSGLCERPNHPTGRRLHYRETRTGNVLLRTNLLGSEAEPFRREFGRGGGEDTDFFRRKAAEGAQYGWCREAWVYESVPQERWKLIYYLNRHFRLGGMLRRRYKTEGLRILPGLVKAASATFWHAVNFAWKLPLGKSAYSIRLAKMAYHSGFIVAAMGFEWDQRRPEMRDDQQR